MKHFVPTALFSALALGLPVALTQSPDRRVAHPADEGCAPHAGTTVALTSRVSHPWLLAESEGEVYLCATLAAPTPVATRRLGLNLALVIDRSGSMASEDKLEYAKRAAEQLVDRLRPDDRLAIVAYDDAIRTLVPSTPARERDVFLSAIRSLHSGNRTNLFGGMVAGCREILGRFDEERLNRVLLLSDGLANVGVTDLEAIGRHARHYRERGLRISTMGMGVDYDEVLMRTIAERAGGNYAYIAHPEEIGRQLDRELDELSRVVARDVLLEVRLGAGVEVRDVFGYGWDRRDGVLSIPVSDLFAGERRKVVIRLRVSASAPASAPAASTSLRYVDAATGEVHLDVAPAHLVRRTASAEQVERSRDRGVLSKAELVRDAEALETAMRHQKAGEIDFARQLLTERSAASRRLNETLLRSAEITRIVDRMDSVALELERTRHDRWARIDLQFRTQLTALGYAQDD